MSTDLTARARVWEDFYRDVNRLTSTAVAYWSGWSIFAVALLVRLQPLLSNADVRGA